MHLVGYPGEGGGALVLQPSGVLHLSLRGGSATRIVAGDTVDIGTTSPDGAWVAVTTTEKQLQCFHRRDPTGPWTLLGARGLPKRASSLIFDGQGCLVVADKAGDLRRLVVADLGAASPPEPEYLLGHVSILLHAQLTADGRHILTCDRDEKVRVSQYPRAWNIESFCLGHAEFVSASCTVPGHANLVLTGSGDGTVKLWDYASGALKAELVLPSPDDGAAMLVQRLVPCAASGDIVVVPSRQSLVLVLRYDAASQSILLATTLATAAHVHDATFDTDGRLWVAVAKTGEEAPVLSVLERGARPDGEPLYSPMSDAAHAKLLGDWNAMPALCGANLAETADLAGMCKTLVDQPSQYFERKTKRLEGKQQQRGAKSNKKARTEPAAQAPGAAAAGEAPPADTEAGPS